MNEPTRRIELFLPIRTVLIVAAAIGIAAAFAAIGQTFLIVFVGIFLVPLCETRWNGRTPGKALLGLRVVTDVGETIGFGHALIRSLIQLVELPTGIALVAALSNPRNQRLGDLSAGMNACVGAAGTRERRVLRHPQDRGNRGLDRALDRT